MSQRLAVIRATAELLVELCKAGSARYAEVIENALPSDAMFVRAGHDMNGTLRIVVSSESFAEVPEGGVIPELPPTKFMIRHVQ